MYRKATSGSQVGENGHGTPGHTTIFELTLLVILFYVVRILIYPKSFVCLFVHSFIYFFGYFVCNNTDLRPNMPEVTTGSRGYKQARANG